jgi:lipid II:glycine glycyltransferase (peptidoglycan interpeptide bridge formation enzyme)
MLDIKYFYQTQEWREFFLKANSSLHDVHDIDFLGFNFQIFEYPLYAKQNFWYIPRGFGQQNNIDSPKLLELLTYLKVLAQQNNDIVFIKFEIEDIYYNHSDENINSFQFLKEFLTNKHIQKSENIVISNRQIQYLSTIILDLSNLQVSKANDLTLEALSQLYEQNTDWFCQNLDKRTRYGTKQALSKNWNISSLKTKSNFDKFYDLLADTAIRQGFNIHSYQYLKTLFEMDFSRFFVLFDNNAEIKAGWMGVNIEGVYYNLFGANSQYSRDNYGQYLSHLLAIYLAKTEDVKYYDLGGLDNKSGFDLFKKGYKGQVINWLGPYDLILKPLKYNLYNQMREIKNLVKIK